MRAERGFSLIELLVAIVMTLIVSGAIYGLMAGGQGAFKREPALIDRQQNIRVALDMIVRDLENAGSGLTGYVTPNNPDPLPGPLTQIFTPGLNNLGPAASAIQAGLLADAVEAFVVDGSCPTLRVCANSSDAANLYLYPTTLPTNGCMGIGPDRLGNVLPPLSFFAYISSPAAQPELAGAKSTAVVSNRTPGILFVTSTAHQPEPLPFCGNNTAAATRAHLAIPPGQTPSNPCAGGACKSLTRVSLVRYEIAGENPALPVSFGPSQWLPAAPPLNPPCLWRSEYGRLNRDGTLNAGPYINPPGANNPWEMVARGIDDLQIDYQTAVEFLGATPDTSWLTTPPTLANPPLTAAPIDTDGVVRRVRITLSARAIGSQLGGESRYATNNVPATEPGRRGQLTTIVTPRAALKTLRMDSRPNRNWR